MPFVRQKKKKKKKVVERRRVIEERGRLKVEEVQGMDPWMEVNGWMSMGVVCFECVRRSIHKILII